MRRWMAVLGALLITGWMTTAMAQQTAPPAAQPGTPSPGGVMEKTMEGKIKAINQAGKKVTLADGTQFSVPAAAKVEWTKLKPGTMVAIYYEEQGGQKMVKRVEVKS